MRSIDDLLAFAALRSSRCYRHISTYASRSCQGKQLAIPIRHGLGRSNLKPFSSELVRAISLAGTLGPGTVFVDVGANIGQSLVTLLCTGRERYIGFEPDLEAAAYVAALIRKNRLAEAVILPIALGEAQAIMTLHTGPAGWVGATVAPDLTPAGMYSFQQRVMVSTGDAQLSHLPDGDVLLLKIDVEGHEVAALRGLRQTLRRTRAPVYCEVLGYDHFRDGSYGRDYFGELSSAEIDRLCESREANGRAVAEEFHRLEYAIFEFTDHDALREVESIDLASARPGRQGERNVFAVPRERAGVITERTA